MMWHWNSLWAPAPGDPPAIDDPSLWQMPWSVEQAIALQTRNWEAMLSATHSWWTMALAAWPLANTWPVPVWNAGVADKAATAGAEPLVPAAAVATEAPKPARKRTPARKR
jgi:hypothetical protein